MNKDNIMEWYVIHFPTDYLGESINPYSTFTGLLNLLDGGGDVYNYLGVGDSVIRERVFEELAKSKGVSYDEIYSQWLLQ